MTNLPPHRLELALLQPQIAPNTGNIARLCVATGTPLHIVRPMGFVLDDKQLRRSAMDYWPRLKLTIHDDDEAFFAAVADRRFWLFDSVGERSLFDADFLNGDVLILGSESRGSIRNAFAQARTDFCVSPRRAGERCLNLSTAAGIALYGALGALSHLCD